VGRKKAKGDDALPPPLEKDVQKAIVEYLTLIGFMVLRINSGALRIGDRFVRFNSARGCSDLLVVAKPSGRLIAVEVKREGNKPTELQEAFLEEVRRAGGVALCVSSVDQLRAELRAAGFDVP
jgi:hypothetical protein